MTAAVLVAAGAAIGAPLRYVTDRFVQSRHDSVFPWGTLAVNVLACLALGLLVGATADSRLIALFGTGFCGALSTYSTFSYETLRLAQDGARFYAVASVFASILAGLGSLYLGLAMAGALGS